MTYLQAYLVPYLISNIIALFLLWLSWKAPRWARWSFVLIFIWAGSVNTYTSLTTPDVYLEYAQMAIPLYRSFILGWFVDHVQFMVLPIATGQFLIALFLALGGKWLKIGVIGGIIFLFAIMPLGVGSGFPCTLILAIALFSMYRKLLVPYTSSLEASEV